jgi:TRAP-type mannitol/chloroaromatic compound transport system permease large subunit
MNPIIQLLKELNINEEKINELFQALTENPLMAMGVIQQLEIPPEKLQTIMGLVMTQPELIKEAVEELGLDFSKVEAAKATLKTSTQS